MRHYYYAMSGCSTLELFQFAIDTNEKLQIATMKDLISEQLQAQKAFRINITLIHNSVRYDFD